MLASIVRITAAATLGLAVGYVLAGAIGAGVGLALGLVAGGLAALEARPATAAK